MKNEIKDIGKHLREHGIKPSYQRMKVFEYLVENKNHPTVDMIYQTLVKEIPTFSRTTVYNTLDLFIEKRLAIMITIDEKETRYDANTDVHSHFQCNSCGSIYDLDTDMGNVNIPGLYDHNVEEYHMYFKGTCSKCSDSGSANSH
ncbi:MAG: transcriptional repressor [Acidobacteriota bacterium]